MLYLLQRSANGKTDRVLSLCKLKTLEYRLFRKMREKLRNTLSKNDSPPEIEDFRNLSTKFARESKDLCGDSLDSLSMPFDFYK